ncbi:aspartate-semialdehyde dehydrogenase [Patescibacteria group bacterium]|nr:aspartate-semialdehyde dehydrogenase [Patescibacteria group bacterium]MBU1876995.1 aspartate-semialdehyde dehydrogenase [Patescibacteria group bacterium]
MSIGFVGRRGMVGSVLIERMREERDFKHIPDCVFFSTSNVGGQGPIEAKGQLLEDANSITALGKCDIIVTCQGSEWTSKMYPQLKKKGWEGIWLDTASALRMEKNSIIVLDPLNREMIKEGLKKGIKTFVGGNCTVSLMLMACHGLFEKNLVEWINSDTYQAASGAGANHMQELIKQMMSISKVSNPVTTALELDRVITECLRSSIFPTENFGVPLACNLIPWIDRAVKAGQTKEEWKGFAEANKILGRKKPIPISGTCVRIGAMRCHSQALLIKLKNDITLNEISEIIATANEWVKVIPNEEEATIKQLTPAAVSGTLNITIGRLRKARMGPDYLQAFTVGDQLLWGAAEPIRRTLRIILKTL